MPSVLDASNITLDRAADPTSSDHGHPELDRHPELDAATRRWLAQGENPEVVATYARALRKLIGDL
jgi:hypothetical protein